MSYAAVSGILHDGSPGVHLVAETCPTGCYQCSSTLWAGATADEMTKAANDALAADGKADVQVAVASKSPLGFSISLT